VKSQKFFLFTLAFFFFCQSFAQKTKTRKMENVVYGMVSGTALLMDVYIPAKPLHKAIVFIPGSAWGYVYPRTYDQVPLKADMTLDTNFMAKWGASLIQHGYTVFVINHRFSPKFQYADIINDCQRAVKFIRYHAKDYQIDADHIGAMGHSSGAYLSSMLGVEDSKKVTSKSPIDSISSRVQAVVTLAAPFNLADFNEPEDSTIDNEFVLSAVGAYMGGLPEKKEGHFILAGKFAEASPISLVSSDDAPTLIYYSDDDPVIPPRQAKKMYASLLQNKVAAKIFEIHKASHTPTPDMEEVCKWFEKYLR